MKKFLFLTTLTFSASALSAPPDIEFCSTAELAFSEDDCIASCTALQENGIYLSSGNYGFCVGQATYLSDTIYKVALGNDSSSEPSCTIYENTSGLAVVKSSNLPDAEIDLGSGASCDAGTYDVLYVTYGARATFAGETTIPSAEGGTLRTTSTFASDTISSDATYTTWLDEGTLNSSAGSHNFSTNSKIYSRPHSGWNTVYKKLGTTPMAASDFTSGTNEQMEFDWAKEIYINYTNTTGRDGWVCEEASWGDGVNACARIPASGKYEERYHNSVDGIEGLPLTVTADDVISFNISYYSVSENRSDLDAGDDVRELGLKVLFGNFSGTTKAIGAYPGETGGYFIFSKASPTNTLE